MNIKELNKFSKETILKALKNNWLVQRELSNIIDSCYSLEINKINEEYEKILGDSPQKPVTDDFKSKVKYMEEVQKYMDKCEKYSKKLNKLYEARKNCWRKSNE
ncbi:hypothetical protein [Clostridium sp.]|uniref:hypothetical protein n=1 Tax=Clostridium sp. TaxID=1506 RepID=UPI003990E76C